MYGIKTKSPSERGQCSRSPASSPVPASKAYETYLTSNSNSTEFNKRPLKLTQKQVTKNIIDLTVNQSSLFFLMLADGRSLRSWTWKPAKLNMSKSDPALLRPCI